jgi:intraflagellar transport protein 52
LYVNGSTLNVIDPSKPILSSAALSYPSNRPLSAVFETKNGKGRMAVIGSYEMFTDEYFEKEDN